MGGPTAVPGGVATRQMRVLGQRVRYTVRSGTGVTARKRPLVLCNGIGASLEVLTPFVDALPPSIEVVRFDVPGVGGSPLPNVPYSFAGMAVLMRRLLDRLGYQHVDVLGLSWGGALAQQFAFQHPMRCRRLVLVGTATGCLMVPAHPAVLQKMLTPRRYRDREYAHDVAADLYGGKIRHDPSRVRDVLHLRNVVASRRGYALQLAAGWGWSSLPALPLIRQPTLIVAGEDDPIVPLVNARVMKSLLPHSELLTHRDGHLGLLTSADEIAPAIAEFLDR
jgi:poly(3-hydroxyalkanoate) depolymerase